jgi:hypothetical protein
LPVAIIGFPIPGPNTILRNDSYIPRTESTAELAAMLDRERVRWTEVARMYGAKPLQ